MSQVTISTDDIVEAFCKMLEPGIQKNVLPAEDCNRYGVDVLYNKKANEMIMFHFVTRDMLEVNIEMDLIELQRRGKEYMDHLHGLLCDQTQQARDVRQKEGEIVIYTGSDAKNDNDAGQKNEPPKLKPTVAAHNEVIH